MTWIFLILLSSGDIAIIERFPSSALCYRYEVEYRKGLEQFNYKARTACIRDLSR